MVFTGRVRGRGGYRGRGRGVGEVAFEPKPSHHGGPPGKPPRGYDERDSTIQVNVYGVPLVIVPPMRDNNPSRYGV